MKDCNFFIPRFVDTVDGAFCIVHTIENVQRGYRDPGLSAFDCKPLTLSHQIDLIILFWILWRAGGIILPGDCISKMHMPGISSCCCIVSVERHLIKSGQTHSQLYLLFSSIMPWSLIKLNILHNALKPTLACTWLMPHIAISLEYQIFREEPTRGSFELVMIKGSFCSWLFPYSKY